MRDYEHPTFEPNRTDYVRFRGVPVHTHALQFPATEEQLRRFAAGYDPSCPICVRLRKHEEEEQE